MHAMDESHETTTLLRKSSPSRKSAELYQNADRDTVGALVGDNLFLELVPHSPPGQTQDGHAYSTASLDGTVKGLSHVEGGRPGS